MKILLAADGSAYTKKALAFLVNHKTLVDTHDELLVLNVQLQVPSRVKNILGSTEVAAYHREEAENTNLPGGAVMRFTAMAADVTNGAKEILELLMWDSLRREGVEGSDTPELEQQPVLTPYSRGVLMQFARASLDMLNRESERMQEWAFEYHTPEGRSERYRQALHSLKSHRQPVPATSGE